VATLHDFSAALQGKHGTLPAADAHVLHITQAASTVLELARKQPRSPSTAVDVDAIGALIADWASQLAILVDGEQRVAAQYINRLANLMREQAKGTDPLRIEVLAWAMLQAAESMHRGGANAA